MNNITIQIASAVDIEELAQVEVESKIKSIPECVEDIEIDYQSTKYRWQTYFKGESPNGSKSGRLILKAEIGDKIVGFIAGHLTTRYEKDAEIQSFYVLKEYQRKRIGTDLFHTLTGWMMEQGVRSLCVGFALENKYQAFYLKKGGRYLNPHWICWDNLEEIAQH
ncbi:MAG: family N-acetyltransferase [Ferruginibacter sp.]|nr:family N-acetyltransferase [Ferruginibacter sp.]